jgi:hypothetical protein
VCCAAGIGITVSLEPVEETMSRLLGISMLVIGASTVAFASAVRAPELDGGTAMSALALLAGSVVILRARFRRK